MHAEGASFENQPLRGWNVKNLIVTIGTTATIVITVLTTYFDQKSETKDLINELRSEIKDLRNTQDTDNKINDLRFKSIEEHLNILDAKVDEMKKDKKKQ